MNPARLVVAIPFLQAPGTPEAELAQVADAAYAPLLEALERHPHARVGLFLSGPVLEALEASRPGLLEAVRGLLEKGQVELLGGGLEAPVLPALPDRDALGQLEAQRARIQALFGAEVRGAWLDGSWEPDLPRLLSGAGLRFTFVDQALLRASGAPGRGPFVTDRGGAALALLPLDVGLGARLGAEPAEPLLAAVRGCGACALAAGAERLGRWPELDGFLRGLGELREQVALLPPSELLVRSGPEGKVFPPGADWAAGLNAAPELRALRARMLHASNKLAEAEAELGETPRLAAARRELYRGQAGALYRVASLGQPQLRHAAYAALIRADNLVDAETRGEGDFIEYEEDDLDADLRDEALLANAQVAAWVAPERGGGLYELDFRPLATCVTHVPGRADGYLRACFLDRFHAPGFGLEQLQKGGDGDLGDFASGPYAIEASGVDEDGDLSASVTLVREAELRLPDGPRRLLVEKTFHVPIDAPRVETEYILENPSDAPVAFTFAPELSFTLLAAGEPERYLELPDGQRASLAARRNHGLCKGVRLLDEQQGVAVDLVLDREVELWSYPVEDGGAYQGTCLLLRMALALPPRESARIVIRTELAKVELEPEAEPEPGAASEPEPSAS